MIRRLGLLVGLALLSFPTPVAAQPGRIPRVGLLCSVSCTPAAMQAFNQTLRSHGYVDGKTVAVEHRREDEDADRVDALARELIGKPVDVLVAMDAIPAWVARYHTRTIPVVAGLLDATVLGRVERPAANVTGLSFVWRELAGKRLQLLKEAVPRVARVGVIWRSGWWGAFSGGLQEAAPALRMTLRMIDLSNPAELESVFAIMVRERLDAFITGPHDWFVVHRAQIARLALKHRLPAVYELREQAEAGGLMAYGPSPAELYSRAAGQVARILRGAAPSEVPIEQPTKLELVLNLKTAKALGLTFPQSVLVRADEVIQ